MLLHINRRMNIRLKSWLTRFLSGDHYKQLCELYSDRGFLL
jgi:hypothetical protein